MKKKQRKRKNKRKKMRNKSRKKNNSNYYKDMRGVLLVEFSAIAKIKLVSLS